MQVFCFFSVSSALHDSFCVKRGMGYTDIQHPLGLYEDNRSPTALICLWVVVTFCFQGHLQPLIRSLVPEYTVLVFDFLGHGVRHSAFGFNAFDQNTAAALIQWNRHNRRWFCPRQILMLRRLWAGTKQALSSMLLSWNSAGVEAVGNANGWKVCIVLNLDDLIWSNLICRSLSLLPGHGSPRQSMLWRRKASGGSYSMAAVSLAKPKAGCFVCHFSNLPSSKWKYLLIHDDSWFITVIISYSFHHFQITFCCNM